MISTMISTMILAVNTLIYLIGPGSFSANAMTEGPVRLADELLRTPVLHAGIRRIETGID